MEAARRQMVDQQVRAWDVLDDRILDTLVAVPRERFVPPAFRDVAFADAEIPLGHGQVMLAPKVDGRILQAIAPLPNETVLEVGTGSGFLTACLARLAGQVTSIEIHEDLAQGARRVLHDLSVHNVGVEAADACLLDTVDGYDVVVVTASLPVY
ncbi:MAG: protein-L-isoaspartate O-methyltransferase family protein, partial [Steroidobacteraceae bacterium]